MPFTGKYTSLALSVAFYIMCILGYSSFEYYHNTKEKIKEIDTHLFNAASSIPILVDSATMNKLVNGQLNLKDYDELVLRLSHYSKVYNIAYLYQLKYDGKNIINVLTSENDNNLLSKTYQRYNEIYPNILPSVVKAIENREITYDSMPDSFGSFRSVYIPLELENGEVHIMGADIDLSEIKQITRKEMLRSIITGVLLLIFASPLVLFTYYNMKKIFNELENSFNHLKIMTNKYKELSSIDPLTSLPNRRSFFDSARREVHKARRHEDELVVLIADIDHFKNVNDKYGHLVGDSVLSAFADKIKADLRGEDLCGRYGGEEFIMLLPNTSLRSAYDICERLRRNCQDNAMTFGELSLYITVSIGVAHLNLEPGLSIDEILSIAIKNSDTALYQAKSGGRNQVVVFQDIA